MFDFMFEGLTFMVFRVLGVSALIIVRAILQSNKYIFD